MNRKIMICIVSFTLILCSACTKVDPTYTPDSNDQVSLDTLVIDQEDTMMAISSNNVDGYNRWILFYLALETDSSEENVVETLNDTIDTIILLDEFEKEICKTESGIWTAYKPDEIHCNLALVVAPEIGEILKNDTQVSQLALVSDGVTKKFALNN